MEVGRLGFGWRLRTSDVWAGPSPIGAAAHRWGFGIGSAERFYVVAFGEVFHTFDNEIEGLAAERLRLSLGLGKAFSRVWRMELNGMFQHGRVDEGVTGFDLDEGILRLRMFYTFN